MIVITNIEYIQVEGTAKNIRKAQRIRPQTALYQPGDTSMTVSIEDMQEWVEGVPFINPTTNEEVYIGNSKDVANLIGIQFKAWHEKDVQNANRIHKIKNQNRAGREKLALALDRRINMHLIDIRELVRHKNATLWQRIKYVFTGKVS